MDISLLIFAVLAICSTLCGGQVFRTACRRDTMMKATDRDKKMTGLVAELNVAAVRYCVKGCTSNQNCLSINYQAVTTTPDEKNCQLLNLTKNSEGSSFTNATGWVHYEPVLQASPRCRNIVCNTGYHCIEKCGTSSGYECVDINECASNPCQNGGTCSNEVNKYTCTCLSNFQGTNCQTEIRACSDNSVCLNGGTCSDLSSDPMLTFRCNCPRGYGGEHCELTSNLARAKTTSQSSIYQIYGANRAVDGSFDTNLWHGSCTHTNADPNAWWRVDLGGVYTIGTVKITNRAIAWERLSNFDVKVGSSLGSSSICFYYSGTVGSSAIVSLTCTSELAGRYVYVVLRGTNYLQLCEVEVFAVSPKYKSCKEIRNAVSTTQNGVYNLWDAAESFKYSAYCHMSDGGWTLISRFSNADAKNWIATSGAYWYDTAAVGATTSWSANSDMINKAFYNAKGTDIKLTRSDSSSHSYLLYSNGCLSTTSFRSKMASYGNFRNNALWGSNKCMGQCSINSYGSVSGVSGFSQYTCSSNIQSSGQIGFWCHYGSGDASVIMIGGGGSACARADHGIAITEENSPRFGTTGTVDFGDNSAGTTAYALNLWIR